MSYITQEIIDQYNLEEMKGMPGLKNPVILVMTACAPILKYGYAPVRHTPVLRKHKKKDIIFTLLVYDFRIKFTSSQ